MRTILMLAQNLNIETVAEGIENQKQLRQLTELGCNFGQGYLFSRPVSPEDARKLIKDGVQTIMPELETSYAVTRLAQDSLIEIEKLQ